jgi:Trypsin-like peptidase domain/Tetratricopeptide repeat/TPR repeat
MNKLTAISICLIGLGMTLFAAPAHARVPDSIIQQKRAVVTVHVDDRQGKHVFSGSGFVLDKDGIIVTNCRVVAKWFAKAENRISIETEGGTQYPFEDLLSPRCENDLILIKAGAEGLPAVRLNADYGPKQGEKIVVVRNPSGAGASISEGTVKRILKKGNLIQTSIPVSQQSSGSPLFNMKGEVIGASVFTKQDNTAVLLKNLMLHLEKYKKRKTLSAHLPKNTMKLPVHEKMDTDDYFTLACSYENSNRYQEAIAAYKQSLQMNPDHVEAYLNLGVVYYKVGKYSDAIDILKQALSVNPYVLPVYNKLGTAYIIRGAYAMAIDTFRKAAEIAPKDPTAHFNLGIAYFLSGDKSAAFEEYVRLKDIDKERADILRDIIMN